MRPFFAHSLPDRPIGDWEPLDRHLGEVGELAATFAEPFGAAAWARIAGRWHDLGKFSASFQEYLAATQGEDGHNAETRGKVDHSTAGAQHAVAAIPILGHLLAHAIAGHHAGLLDTRAAGACLEARLAKAIDSWDTAPRWIREHDGQEPPIPLLAALRERNAFAVAFFTRMLFSCLVDADFLCTERFLAPQRAASRPFWPADVLIRMGEALRRHATGLAPGSTSEVNQARREVFVACLEAAPQSPGFFSLTVPTGGGKTLSSLAFALEHARLHDLQRVVYVIPFTSIIEQNAAEFRSVFRSLVTDGIPDPVLEHHSSLGEENESEQSRLIAENWDSPLVVTTSVQFFESLFANRTSRCRKLHNLSRAVIVLDEAQAMPVDFLDPCLDALREVTKRYGSTVVLCTATQPALERREDFAIGLHGVREIAPDPPALYRRLRRVKVVDIGHTLDEDLVRRLQAEERVLCIVNTRKHARIIAEALGEEEGNFHLSALMCAAHRSARLDRIRHRLANGDSPCRVISTQLVEAGVNLDFPVVYRALGGVDAVAQAAGRCNREGKLKQGWTYVFRSEHRSTETFIEDTASAAAQVLALHADPLSLAAIEHYFRLYYWDQSSRWDRKKIRLETTLGQSPSSPFLLGFATIAERFRLIEDAGRPVLIPWGGAGRVLCDDLRRSGELPPSTLLRRLQRFSVSIPYRLWQSEVGRSFELLHERYAVLYSPEMNYSEQYGLILDRPGDGLLEV